MELAIKFLYTMVNSCSNQAFTAFMSCEDNVEALKNQMRELTNMKNAIDRRIKEAKKKGKEVIAEVDEWLEDVKALEHDAKELDASYNNMFKVLESWSPAVWHQYHLSIKAKKLLKSAESFAKLGNFNEVASQPSTTCFIERPGGTGVGMERVLNQLKLYMEDDEVGVIAICGMGRIGKTNVLEKFNNELIPKSIEHMEWIDMNEVKDIQKHLIQSFELSCPENKSSSERAAYLHKYLKDKKCLLIFDNVWEPLDLKAIGIPVRKCKGVKVILATRSLKVCKRMEAKVVKVKKLHMEYAWSLFLEKAGDTAQQLIARHPMSVDIANYLLKKCDGLPEAIIAIGYAVATKDNIDQWEHLLNLLDTKPWKVQGIQEILSQLKTSYDKLDPKSKACLMYCTLYPEGFSIHKQWIMDYCIGEGIIDDYNEGDDKLGELKVASLLETGYDEERITIHPLVRAMTLWVACECGKSENKWLVQAGMQIKEAPGAEEWTEAQRISLMRNKIKFLDEIPDCPNLETLLIQGNRHLERIHENFFLYMSKLRVLDLSHTAIKQLPSGIAKLVSLQYLDICDTEISYLPEDLGALVNLRFLLLAFMPNLQTIPGGVFVKFCQLQVLYMHKSYGKWKTVLDGIGVDLEELYNLKQLKAFGITIQNIETLEKLARSHRLAKCTRKIHMDGCQLLKRISNDSIGGNFKDLRDLVIVKCNDLKEIMIDGHCLQKLHTLRLEELENVKIVWSKGCFPNLSLLVVKTCHAIGSLIYCNNEEQEHENEDDEEQLEIIDAFPNLTEINLVDLPRLKSLCSGKSVALPSLQVLGVQDCPNLTKLNMVADQLQFVCSSRSWLSNVESADFDISKTHHISLEDME